MNLRWRPLFDFILHPHPHPHLPSLRSFPHVILCLAVEVAVKPGDTFVHLQFLGRAVGGHLTPKNLPLPEQHLELISLEATQPRGDSVRHLGRVQVAGTKDVCRGRTPSPHSLLGLLQLKLTNKYFYKLF